MTIQSNRSAFWNGRRAWRTDDEWKRLEARVRNANGSRAPAVDPGNHRPRNAAFGFVLAAAAAIIVAVVMRDRAQTLGAPSLVAWTDAGQRDTVRLADSTLVILGPSSTIKFSIGPGKRHVELTGLAHFAVVHDSARPFEVTTGNARVIDIGTEFVVRNYPTDSLVRVSVSSGVVQLESAAESKGVRLEAGQAGTVSMDGRTRADYAATAANGSAWLNNQLVFTNEPLDKVAVELSRWFGTNVQLGDSALAQRRVSAVYSEATLDGVLEALHASLGIAATKRDSTIVLSAAGTR